jgi:hypothetical protein
MALGWCWRGGGEQAGGFNIILDVKLSDQKGSQATDGKDSRISLH